MPDRTAHPLVYLDSCVFLDLVTRNATIDPDSGMERWRSAQSLLDAVNAGLVTLASSPLVEAEVTCNGKTSAASSDIRDQLTGWFAAPSTVRTDVDRYLAREALRVLELARPLARKRMGSADAVHLAAAIRLGADYFMTHDEGFPLGATVDDVAVTRPRVVWQEALPFAAD